MFKSALVSPLFKGITKKKICQGLFLYTVNIHLATFNN
nr:MAG TPA: hypothetical protein [Caudoviricetes sp.]